MLKERLDSCLIAIGGGKKQVETFVRKKKVVADNERVSALFPAIIEKVSADFVGALDGPGHLSLHGVRHDNDKVHIYDISIVPTHEELLSERAPYLPFNSQTYPHHIEDNMSHKLLDTHFRLLREDMLASARQIVLTFLQEGGLQTFSAPLLRNLRQMQKRTGKSKSRVFSNAVIHDVRVNRQGQSFELKFDLSRNYLNNWKHSRRLQRGSLVCLFLRSPVAGNRFIVSTVNAKRTMSNLNFCAKKCIVLLR